MIYHISWLYKTLEVCKEKHITSFDGNITFKEFMESVIKDELDKVIDIK